jgi:hypothetical protein
MQDCRAARAEQVFDELDCVPMIANAYEGVRSEPAPAFVPFAAPPKLVLFAAPLANEIAGSVRAGAFCYDLRLARVRGDALARAGFAPSALVYAWHSAPGAPTGLGAQAGALAARALLAGGELRVGASRSVHMRHDGALEGAAGDGALVARGSSRTLEARVVADSAARLPVGLGADMAERERAELDGLVLVVELK